MIIDTGYLPKELLMWSWRKVSIFPPVLDLAWPHLQVTPDFFLQSVISYELNTKASIKYADLQQLSYCIIRHLYKDNDLATPVVNFFFIVGHGLVLVNKYCFSKNLKKCLS